jgi:hypothetical protein
MSEAEVQQVRARVKELTDRAKNDPALQAQLTTDPAGTLRAAGLPEDAVVEYAAAFQSGGEVAGYVADYCGRFYTEGEGGCLGGGGSHTR